MDFERVPEEPYAEFLTHFPQVCVEVVLTDGEGVLVAKRSNEPAKGKWFWPGGRLYKDEPLDEAAHRIADEELGIAIEIQDQLGVHAHFWDESDVVGNPSRHTVNVVYLAETSDPTIALDDQHSDYRFLTEREPALHEYVKLYIDEYDLL